MIKHILLILLFNFTAIYSINAQESGFSKLDNYFETLVQNNKFMGNVYVSRAGKELYAFSGGYVDVEKLHKATIDSRYRVGSISKTYTATLVLLASEQGKLQLTQTLDKFFPQIRNASKITIQDLLLHRSGIYNFTSDQDFLTWHTRPHSRNEMVEIIAKGGSSFEPGTQMGYSNSGYVLLSYILEIVYGTTFDKILKQYITKPLRLVNTGVGECINSLNGDCNSYKFFDKWRIENVTDASVTLGAGGIYSTAKELNAFISALFNGDIISQQSLQTMTTMRDNFGMGVFNVPFGNRMGYGHSGGIDGFNSMFVYFPDDKVNYTLLSNGANMIVNDINITVLSATYNLPFSIPDYSNINLSEAVLNSYLGTYSSSQLPIKLIVTRQNNQLIAQGTGQLPFNLNPLALHKFNFAQAGIVVEFQPEKRSLLLKQGGGVFLMTKE
ncbi:MAG: serine hydrolase domain-containing protein [Marinifilaceae bacterium]